MRSATRLLVLALALLGAGGAGAQGVVTQRILSQNAAKVMAEAALAECRGRGFHTSVAVVDRAGVLLVVLRDELAMPPRISPATTIGTPPPSARMPGTLRCGARAGSSAVALWNSLVGARNTSAV